MSDNVVSDARVSKGGVASPQKYGVGDSVLHAQ